MVSGLDAEDEMVEMYPLCLSAQHCCGLDRHSCSVFLPFQAHRPPTSGTGGIALAAAGEWPEKWKSSTALTVKKLIWLHWQRPGFELAMMLREGRQGKRPDCDGMFGRHGLLRGGHQHQCYANTITIIASSGNSYPSTSKDGEQICLAGTVPPLLKIIFLSRKRSFRLCGGACLPSSA